MIPKVIYFTHKNEDYIDKDVVDEWKLHNPNYEIKFFDNERVETFLKQHYPKFYNLFQQISPSYGAMKSDMWRYLIIYHNGGFYLDHKIRILKPLDDFLNTSKQLCVSFKGKHRDFYSKMRHSIYNQEQIIQYCFGAEKKAIQLASVIDLMYERLTELIEKKPFKKSWKYILDPGTRSSGMFGTFYTTGPLMFTEALLPHLDSMSVLQDEFDSHIEYPKTSPCAYAWQHLITKTYHFSTEEIIGDALIKQQNDP